MTAPDAIDAPKPANVAELWTNLQASVQALEAAKGEMIRAQEVECFARSIEKADRQAFNAAVHAERPQRPRKVNP